jgi:hypothetical protein
VTQQPQVKVYSFPSGATFVVHPVAHSKGDGKPKPLKQRDRACEFVGKAIAIKNRCSGAGRGSVWECTHPELTGKCAPLDILPIAAPGCVTCATCPHYKPAAEPGYAKLGTNLLSAIKRWVLAGRPVRTPEKVNELLKVCRSCPFFVRDPRGDYCGKCGCPVNDQTDNPIKHRNKLVLATETCPADPPLWIDSAGSTQPPPQ